MRLREESHSKDERYAPVSDQLHTILPVNAYNPPLAVGGGYKPVIYTQITNGDEKRDERLQAGPEHEASLSTGFSNREDHHYGEPNSRPSGRQLSKTLGWSSWWATDWFAQPQWQGHPHPEPERQAALVLDGQDLATAASALPAATRSRADASADQHSAPGAVRDGIPFSDPGDSLPRPSGVHTNSRAPRLAPGWWWEPRSTESIPAAPLRLECSLPRREPPTASAALCRSGSQSAEARWSIAQRRAAPPSSVRSVHDWLGLATGDGRPSASFVLHRANGSGHPPAVGGAGSRNLGPKNG